MPISTYSIDSSLSAHYDDDTYSLTSQTSSTLTIGDSLPAQLVRKTARKGFTFNIMSVGPDNFNKTTVISALFGRNLEISRDSTVTNKNEMLKKDAMEKDPLNPIVTVNEKTFEFVEKRVKLRLTVAESENYGDALCLKGTHIPLVSHIDSQFADYYKRESSHDRRMIKDKMVHCLFFFISPYGHGLSAMDIQFLKSIHDRVNVIPIIARAETLTMTERIGFKKRVKEDLKKNGIQIYKMSSPDPEDPDELKKLINDIQDAMPFAVSSMALKEDNTPMERCLDWGRIDPFNMEHSDFILLKSMLNMQIPDLCEITHEKYYEDFRLRMIDKQLNTLRC